MVPVPYLLSPIFLLLSSQVPNAGPAGGELQTADEVPNQISGVGIEEKLGAEIPSQLTFKDMSGATVTLGDVLKDARPTILTFNYSDCPMLCSVQLDFFAKTLGEMRWTLGKEYRIVTVSLNPKESPKRASETREKYLKTYGRALPADEAGWTFLVGDESSVKSLADTVGFKYAQNPETGEYYHAAALIILTGDRKVSRYLYGIKLSPETLRLSLVEASEGHLVTTIDRAVLYCFHYDPTAGSYTLAASNLMQLAGALTVLILLVVLGRAFLKRHAEGEFANKSSKRSNPA